MSDATITFDAQRFNVQEVHLPVHLYEANWLIDWKINDERCTWRCTSKKLSG
jgi:hypothetical protein